jgi:glycosyltransferase involved in cell wall biosynthesis
VAATNNTKRLVATVVLTFAYVSAGVLGLVRLLYKRPGREGRPLVLIGTFHNPNWVWAHVQPLAAAHHGQVILVADAPIPHIDNLICRCPPPWVQRICSRAGAKLLWSVLVAIRYRPAVCMGYHVFPAGVIALVAATLSGARSSFQVTSGPLELEGGGWHAENAVLIALQYRSAIVEWAVLFMVRQFDWLIVRGVRAAEYLRDIGFAGRIDMITGSVAYPPTVNGWDQRDVDILFVGRLTEYKRPDRFVKVMSLVRSQGLAARAVMIGDGPDKPALLEQMATLNVADQIELVGQRHDVEDFHARAKLIVLTSRWEGVSIAMLEAMAHGVVPVVSDVGDLRDFVIPTTGFLLQEDDLDGFGVAIGRLLSDKAEWSRYSAAARDLIARTSSKNAVTQKWHEALLEICGETPRALRVKPDAPVKT